MVRSLRLIDLSGSERLLSAEDAPLASGADGAIHLADGDRDLVLKLYHDPQKDPVRLKKLQAMMADPPVLPDLGINGRRYVQIAWPKGWLVDQAGRFVGFAMPKVDLARATSLENLLSKKSRASLGIPDSYGFRITAAANLASVVAELHAHGHHIIDLKPINLNVYTDTFIIAVLDCDGLSIHGTDGERFPAHQYTDGFICPEALQQKLPPQALAESQDRFALAVILFQLLNQGIHPYQGIPAKGAAIPPTNGERVEKELYAYGRAENRLIAPSPWSIHEFLDIDTRKLFDRAFTTRHDRPSAAEWRDHLLPYANKSTGKTIVCSKYIEHVHFSMGCPWCALEKKKNNVRLVQQTQTQVIDPTSLAKLSRVQHVIYLAHIQVNVHAKFRITQQHITRIEEWVYRRYPSAHSGNSGQVDVQVTRKSGNNIHIKAISRVVKTVPVTGQMPSGTRRAPWGALTNLPVRRMLMLLLAVVSIYHIIGYWSEMSELRARNESIKSCRQYAEQTVISDNAYSLRMLLASCKDVNIRNDITGTPAITMAARYGRTDLFHIFIAAGSSTEIPDAEGKTPLLVAMEARQFGAAQTLLEFGANPWGVLPEVPRKSTGEYDLAEFAYRDMENLSRNPLYPIVEVLEKHDAPTGFASSMLDIAYLNIGPHIFKWSSTMLAADSGDWLRVAEASYEDLSYKAWNGMRAFDVAVTRGRYDIAALVLPRLSDPVNFAAPANPRQWYREIHTDDGKIVSAENESELMAKALRGNRGAQRTAAMVYAMNNKYPDNKEVALSWLLKSAQHGNARAQLDLGWCHEVGFGTPMDIREADKWYAKAERQGLEVAKMRRTLLNLSKSGIGELVEILEYYSDKGHGEAAFNLGLIHLYGQYGFGRNTHLAISYLEQAAEADYAPATFYLDWIHRVLLSNMSEGHKWREKGRQLTNLLLWENGGTDDYFMFLDEIENIAFALTLPDDRDVAYKQHVPVGRVATQVGHHYYRNINRLRSAGIAVIVNGKPQNNSLADNVTLCAQNELDAHYYSDEFIRSLLVYYEIMKVSLPWDWQITVREKAQIRNSANYAEVLADIVQFTDAYMACVDGTHSESR